MYIKHVYIFYIYNFLENQKFQIERYPVSINEKNQNFKASKLGLSLAYS